MKLRIASDLHLEFVYDYHYIDKLIPRLDTDKETTLALLGDIHVGIDGRTYIDEMCKRFKHVIYIFGNHEFYGYDFYTLRKKFHDKTFHIPNLHVLENEALELDGIKFAGCTLWTDMNKGNLESIFNVTRPFKGLNDYRCITNGDITVTAVDTIEAHKASVEYLKKEVDKDTIVLTHHAPMLGLSDPQFKNSKITSGFESDLTDLIVDLQPKYWLYGHTHYNTGRIEVENTILLSNQMGYVHEPMPSYNPELLLEV